MFNQVTVGRTYREYVPYEKTVVVKRESTITELRALEDIKAQVLRSVFGTVSMLDGRVKAVLFRDTPTPSFGVTVMTWCRVSKSCGGLLETTTTIPDWEFLDAGQQREVVAKTIRDAVAAAVLEAVPEIDIQWHNNRETAK